MEGELDAEGKFKAKFDLAKDHEELKDRDYQRFEDVSLVAYVTDASSGRTEERRFDLRVTRDPIHMYMIQPEYSLLRNLPVEFFVSTSTADGMPAECHVTVRVFSEDPSKRFEGADPNSGLLGTLNVQNEPAGVGRGPVCEAVCAE